MMLATSFFVFSEKPEKNDELLLLVLCVPDSRSQRLAGNKCMLPECCAAHHDTVRPDDEQRDDEHKGKM